jgi:hypothetical protein
MDDVTQQLNEGPVRLYSKTTATVFSGRTRSFRTGVTAEQSDLSLETAEEILPSLMAVEAGAGVGGAEVLVTLRNDSQTPILVEEGDLLATAWAGEVEKGRVIELDLKPEEVESPLLAALLEDEPANDTDILGLGAFGEDEVEPIDDRTPTLEQDPE